MERLKRIKECLLVEIEEQMGHLECVDAEELGEVVDMIKDLEEAMYYCSIVKAMEDADKEEKIEMMVASMQNKMQQRQQAPENHYYYTERIHERPYMMGDQGEYNQSRMGREDRMYYGGGQGNSSGSSNSSNSGSSMGNGSGSRSYYHEREWPVGMRDEREGRSPMSRRMYMESKEMHKDGTRELEAYMKELGEDITEMIRDASHEERQMLQKKLAMLAQKITAND